MSLRAIFLCLGAIALCGIGCKRSAQTSGGKSGKIESRQGEDAVNEPVDEKADPQATLLEDGPPPERRHVDAAAAILGHWKIAARTALDLGPPIEDLHLWPHRVLVVTEGLWQLLDANAKPIAMGSGAVVPAPDRKLFYAQDGDYGDFTARSIEDGKTLFSSQLLESGRRWIYGHASGDQLLLVLEHPMHEHAGGPAGPAPIAELMRFGPDAARANGGLANPMSHPQLSLGESPVVTTSTGSGAHYVFASVGEILFANDALVVQHRIRASFTPAAIATTPDGYIALVVQTQAPRNELWLLDAAGRRRLTAPLPTEAVGARAPLFTAEGVIVVPAAGNLYRLGDDHRFAVAATLGAPILATATRSPPVIGSGPRLLTLTADGAALELASLPEPITAAPRVSADGKSIWVATRRDVVRLER